MVAAHPELFRVSGLAVHHATERLLEQARQFGVTRIAVADRQAAAQLRGRLPAGLTLLAGDEGVEELAGATGADMVVCALVGMAGLRPVLAAIRAGRDVALPPLSVLVAADESVMREREARRLSCPSTASTAPSSSACSPLLALLRPRRRRPPGAAGRGAHPPPAADRLRRALRRAPRS